VSVRRRLAAAVAAAAFAVGAVACGGDDDAPPASPTTTTTTPAAVPSTDPGAGGPGTTTAPTPAPPGPQPLASISVQLTAVADLAQPTALAVRTGDSALYVVEKGGRVRAVRNGAVDPTNVLDLSDDVSTGSEQGLLGVAFSPDGGKLYVNYTNTDGDTRVVEYAFAGGRADPSTARELLAVDQPYANHNGGNLVFGPDGKLWIGLGDGGSGNDPENRAQNLGVLLGKMLRIDPTPSGGRPYTVPSDNPFVGRDGARPEIWSFGLRNPWRYSFDRQTGDLWIGDVGQNAVEEVDFAPAGSPGGENWGWPALEGTRSNKGSAPANAVGPILDYRQDQGGCSVTGGYVYRGAAIPALAGAYLYGDYCAGDVLGLRQLGGQVTEEADLGLDVAGLSSFGQDGSGELYALSLEGTVYRIDPA
jgi:glucose/arabinose dehydrogenase